MAKQRKIPEGYQPIAPEGYKGPGKPPSGGSGARPARSRSGPVNLTGKTIRLYETCPKCEGSGYSEKYPEITCPPCGGMGTVTSHVKFEDIAEALQAIARGAAAEDDAEIRAGLIFNMLKTNYALTIGNGHYQVMAHQPDRDNLVFVRQPKYGVQTSISRQDITTALLRGDDLALKDQYGNPVSASP